jgi:hypothetical protein
MEKIDNVINDIYKYHEWFLNNTSDCIYKGKNNKINKTEYFLHNIKYKDNIYLFHYENIKNILSILYILSGVRRDWINDFRYNNYFYFKIIECGNIKQFIDISSVKNNLIKDAHSKIINVLHDLLNIKKVRLYETNYNIQLSFFNDTNIIKQKFIL